MSADGRGRGYRAGIATIDITPPVGTPLSGFVDRGVHSSTGVYHPLRAVAVAVEDGTDALLVISAEWLGFYEQADRARAMVSEATGLPVDSVLLLATHTHCGPTLGRFDREHHGRIDTAYLERAMRQMAQAAQTAWRYRYPATLTVGRTTCALAVNRRRVERNAAGDAVTEMAPNPDGLVDHDLDVLAITSTADGVTRGVLFSYACHPTSRAGLHIGGDYVGFAYEYLDQTVLSAQPCFLQGCAGDVKTRPKDGTDRFTTRTVDEVRDLGYELGAAVVDLLESGRLRPVAGPLTVRRSNLFLQTEPLDESMLRDEVDRGELPHRRRWAAHHLQRIAQGLPQETEVAFELQTASFGKSLALVAMAGEMTVEHGLRAKRDLAGNFEHVLPIGYANAMIGYVPVRRQFDEFGYEVLDANQYFLRTGRYLPDTEDRIHGRVRQMLVPS